LRLRAAHHYGSIPVGSIGGACDSKILVSDSLRPTKEHIEIANTHDDPTISADVRGEECLRVAILAIAKPLEDRIQTVFPGVTGRALTVVPNRQSDASAAVRAGIGGAASDVNRAATL
jgi:hypothetical protein